MDIQTNNPIPQGTPEANAPMTPSQPSGGKNLVLILVVFFAVVVVGLVIWWLDLSNRNMPNTTATPVVSATPTPAVDADIQTEINDLNVGDADQEFEQIDQDLNSL